MTQGRESAASSELSSEGPTPTLIVAALIERDQDLLLVRSGPGPAGGDWALPGAVLVGGETMAEAVVRAVAASTGSDQTLCGPFIGWIEAIDDSTGSHQVSMIFNAVLMDHERVHEGLRDVPPGSEHPSDAVSEWRWTPIWEVPELRLRDGLTEFLADHDVIDVMT